MADLRKGLRLGIAEAVGELLRSTRLGYIVTDDQL